MADCINWRNCKAPGILTLMRFSNALLERIKQRAMDFGGKVAVGSGERALTYRQLWIESQELASCALGPRFKNRPVALSTPNPLDFTILFLATWMNESIAVPLRNKN